MPDNYGMLRPHLDGVKIPLSIVNIGVYDL